MEEIKSNKNIYAFVLSGLAILMSVFAYIVFVYQLMSGELFWSISKLWSDVVLFYYLISLILSVIGFIIGIKRRKTVSSLSGILGIVTPIIAIILTLFFAFAVELSIFARTT